jgi:phosphatidylserine/phosphatidylglycerophosphate/cardiolipin synthase-like enzyme
VTAPAHPLADLTVLDQFKTNPFPPGFPLDVRTFYSPVDDLHGALAYVIGCAQQEVLLAMFGLDDDALAAALKSKMADPSIHVELTLDSSQAGGVHERTLLATEAFPNSSVAVGRSEHGAIMHLKMLVIDATILVTGSTNWSASAEHLQDNELTVTIHPARAAEARLRIAAIHANMLTKGAQPARRSILWRGGRNVWSTEWLRPVVKPFTKLVKDEP